MAVWTCLTLDRAEKNQSKLITVWLRTMAAPLICTNVKSTLVFQLFHLHLLMMRLMTGFEAIYPKSSAQAKVFTFRVFLGWTVTLNKSKCSSGEEMVCVWDLIIKFL